MKDGSIILLNGSSSSGKTTLSLMLQQLLRDPYQHVALDQFRDGLPGRYRGFNSPEGTTGFDGLNISPVDLNGESVTAVRFGVHGKKLLKGMRRAIATIVSNGLNVIIDDLLFEESFVVDYAHVLAEFDVCIVGVRCPLDVVRQRESERPGRFPGTATWHFDKVHEHMIYDVEVNTASNSPRDCALTVMNALENKPTMSAIRQLTARCRLLLTCGAVCSFHGGHHDVLIEDNDVAAVVQAMPDLKADVIGKGLNLNDTSVDNRQLVEVNAAIRDHSIEVVGRKLRGYMTGMKAIV